MLLIQAAASAVYHWPAWVSVAHRTELERRFGPHLHFLPKPFPADLALRVVREALEDRRPTTGL